MNREASFLSPEQRVQGLYKAVDSCEAIVEYDLTGTIIRVNPVALRLFEYSEDELLGQPHDVLCASGQGHAEEQPRIWESVARGSYYQGIFHRVTKSGKTIYLQASYNPVFDPQGQVTHAVQFAINVTASQCLALENAGILAALNLSHGLAEVSLDGVILNANEHFLALMEYSRAELIGQDHDILLDVLEAQTKEYRTFWSTLKAGKNQTGEMVRVTRSGRRVWLHATYHPIFDLSHKPIKYVLLCQDVSAEKQQQLENKGKIEAISRSACFVEYELDGRVISVNSNFSALCEYSCAELKDMTHQHLCQLPDTSDSAYRLFWERLRKSEFHAGEFKFVSRSGKEFWLQSTFTLIIDPEGKPLKVVQYGTDVTQNKLQSADYQARVAAVDLAQAVIEFDLTGKIITANRNFLAAMGYTLPDIEGQHHSLFCDLEYAHSEEYRDFWLRLSEGQFISGRFARKGKFGRDVWIQATYSPILDLNGKVSKIIKYAYDITKSVQLEKLLSEQSQTMHDSVFKLVTSIEHVASSSETASLMSERASSAARSGFDTILQSKAAVSAIRESANRVFEIVKVISDISSQTNLLAFNAALEAARAGPHGIGFGVVAGEVRKLAERSAQAAKEIGELINHSSKHIAEGAQINDQITLHFEGILDDIANSDHRITEIAKAAKTQQVMAQQVMDSIQKLSACKPG